MTRSVGRTIIVFDRFTREPPPGWAEAPLVRRVFGRMPVASWLKLPAEGSRLLTFTDNRSADSDPAVVVPLIVVGLPPMMGFSMTLLLPLVYNPVVLPSVADSALGLSELILFMAKSTLCFLYVSVLISVMRYTFSLIILLFCSL